MEIHVCFFVWSDFCQLNYIHGIFVLLFELWIGIILFENGLHVNFDFIWFSVCIFLLYFSYRTNFVFPIQHEISKFLFTYFQMLQINVFLIFIELVFALLVCFCSYLVWHFLKELVILSHSSGVLSLAILTHYGD